MREVCLETAEFQPSNPAICGSSTTQSQPGANPSNPRATFSQHSGPGGIPEELVAGVGGECSLLSAANKKPGVSPGFL